MLLRCLNHLPLGRRQVANGGIQLAGATGFDILTTAFWVSTKKIAVISRMCGFPGFGICAALFAVCHVICMHARRNSLAILRYIDLALSKTFCAVPEIRSAVIRLRLGRVRSISCITPCADTVLFGCIPCILKGAYLFAVLRIVFSLLYTILFALFWRAWHAQLPLLALEDGTRSSLVGCQVFGSEPSYVHVQYSTRQSKYSIV